MIVVGGENDPCLQYSLVYAPTSLSVAVTSVCIVDPSDHFPWWAILILVLGSVIIAGAIIAVVLVLRKKRLDKEKSRMVGLASKNKTAARPS